MQNRNDSARVSCPIRLWDYSPLRVSAIMPGAFELLGRSSHMPVHNSLFSQPRLSNDDKLKIPDFMWIANDSLSLCPVFIEIEKPSKLEFRKDSDVGRQVFNQALGQIKHWKAILSDESGRSFFYDYYRIPAKYRSLTFAPQYLLVYGRRQEYEDDTWLTKTRKQYEEADIRIMSFDRLLVPDRNVIDCFTCKVIQSNLIIQQIPPTFVYRPKTLSELGGYDNMTGFESAVHRMEYTTEERKTFLIRRFSYWNEYGKADSFAPINTSDKE